MPETCLHAEACMQPQSNEDHEVPAARRKGRYCNLRYFRYAPRTSLNALSNMSALYTRKLALILWCSLAENVSEKLMLAKSPHLGI